ncbi:hypothetical protein AB4T57_004211 [Vibrio parahaemolyticus]
MKIILVFSILIIILISSKAFGGFSLLKEDFIDYSEVIYSVPITVEINSGVYTDNKKLNFMKNKDIQFVLEGIDKEDLDIIGEIISHSEFIDKINFSCDKKNNHKLCDFFEYLEFEFSLSLGTIKLFYNRRVNNDKIQNNKSSPLLLLHNNLNVIYEKDTSQESMSGFYDLGLTYGISRHSSVKLDSKFVLNNSDSNSLESIRYNDTLFGYGYSLHLGSPSLNSLNSLNKKNLLGVDIYNRNEKITDTIDSVLMINSNYSGILKVYDKYRKILAISKVNLGLNRITIDSDFKGGDVIVETVVNDEVVYTSKEYVFSNGKLNNIPSFNISFGMFDYQEDMGDDWGKVAYSEFKFGNRDFSLNLGMLPRLSVFDLNLKSKIIDFDFEIDYLHDVNNKNEINFLLSREIYIDNIEAILTSSYQYIYHSNSDRVNLTFSKRINNNDNFSITYRNEKSKKTSKSNNMSLSYIANRKYNQFDAVYTLNSSTDFNENYTIGLNLEMKFDGNNWFSPSVNIGYGLSGLNTQIVNNIEYGEGYIQTGMGFSDGKFSSFELGLSSSNDSFNSDGVAHFSRSSNYISYRVSNYSGISKYGYFNSSNDFENAIYINDDLSENEKNIKYDLMLGNSKFSIENRKFIPLNSKWSNGFLDPDTSSSAVSVSTSKIKTGKYRIYPIDVNVNLDKLMVSGRVFLNGKPVSGAYVKSYKGQYYTDKFGYFKLEVSRENKKIEVILENAVCDYLDLIDSKYSFNQTDLYIGRILCTD